MSDYMKRKLTGDVTPKCEYCKHGRPSAENTILCNKKGVLEKDFSCKKFSYDPLKRIPEKKAVLPEFSKEDFEL